MLFDGSDNCNKKDIAVFEKFVPKPSFREGKQVS